MKRSGVHFIWSICAALISATTLLGVLTQHAQAAPLTTDLTAALAQSNGTNADAAEILRLPNGQIRQSAFSPDNKQLAVATTVGLLLINADVDGPSQLVDANPVQSIWWSADSRLVAAIQDSGTLQLWLVSERRLLATLSSNSGKLRRVGWSADSSRLATGTDTGVIELWQATDGRLLQTLPGHQGAVTTLVWSPDGRILLSGAEDNTVLVWRVAPASAQNAPLATPLPTPLATPLPPAAPIASANTPVVATLLVNMNLRAGAGTTFNRIGGPRKGAKLTVMGQVQNCAWLQVRTAENVVGWVAGAAQYVTLSAPCAAVASEQANSALAASVVANPTLAPPTPTPQSPLPPLKPVATAASPIAPPTPVAPTPADQAAPVSPPERSAASNLPANQGCFVLQNLASVELTITVVRLSDQRSNTVKLPTATQAPLCLDPGRYGYNIVAAGVALKGEWEAKAGVHFLFPIRPAK